MTGHRKSFLFATWEAGGTISPMLAAAQKLIARGHRVRLLADACARTEAEAAGVQFTAWTNAPSKAERTREHDYLEDWKAPTPAEGIQDLIETVLTGAAGAYAKDVRAALDAEPCDLVVASDFLFGVHAACEAAGQPFAVLTANLSLIPMAGAPPLGPGLAPARTDAERALHAEIAEGVHAMFNAGLAPLNAARGEMGLAPLARVADQHKAALKILLGTARAFDFAPDTLPEGVHYVGPQLADPAWAAPWTSPFPAQAGRKRMLVAFSTTFQNHTDTLQRVLDAMAALPVDAVVTLGGSIYAHELRAPANVTLLDSAPHGPAMAASDIVVTHGGHGTVMKALYAQKPMLILPHGRDQADNAIRVTERGAGLALMPTAGVEEIRAALARLIAERSFAAAAETLGARIIEEARESPVADILEGLAETARRPHDGLRAA